MTIYYRVSDAALRDITPEQYAALALNKRAELRIYIVDAQPIPTAGQVVIAGGVVVGPVEAHLTYTLRAKTAAELDVAADVAELTQLRAAISALQADVAAGITTAPTTAAQAFIEIQDLKRRALRADRILLWLLKRQ